VKDTNELKIGQIVIAHAGRDASRPMLIIKIVNEEYVLVADGILRRIERPKLKKVKHLKKTHTVVEEIAKRLSAGESPMNADIKKAIEHFTLKTE
jgi:ribosomal protein L14E/L6E/L27E